MNSGFSRLVSYGGAAGEAFCGFLGDGFGFGFVRPWLLVLQRCVWGRCCRPSVRWMGSTITIEVGSFFDDRKVAVTDKVQENGVGVRQLSGPVVDPGR